MSRSFARTAVTLATTAAVFAGCVGVSAAQEATGSLSGLFGGGAGGAGGSSQALGSLGGGDLPVAAGEKKLLGNIGGPAYNVDLYTQLHSASGEVAPGGTFTVRVEIQGVNGDTRIDEVMSYMPANFTLVKVQRMKDSVLGSAPVTLKQGEFAQRVVDGRNEVRVSWADGLIFPKAPMVNRSTPLVVDFTWKAPEQEGSYVNGAGAKVGSLINPEERFDAAQRVVVKKGAGVSGSLAGSSAGGAKGSLG